MARKNNSPLDLMAELMAALTKGPRTRKELLEMVSYTNPDVLKRHLTALDQAGLLLHAGLAPKPEDVGGRRAELFELAPWPFEGYEPQIEQPRRVLYLAGPMSGLPELNYPAFHAAAAVLRGRGFTVLNPAENPAPDCGTWRGYMRMALRQLAQADWVAMLPRWERSRGARIEYRLARELGLRVVMAEDLIKGGGVA